MNTAANTIFLFLFWSCCVRDDEDIISTFFFFDELMINERTPWNNKLQQKLLSLFPWLQSIKEEGITFAWQPHQPYTLIKN